MPAADGSGRRRAGHARAAAGTVLALATGLAAPACRFAAPEPTPLRGDPPASIVVWPWVGDAHDASRELLLADLGPALGRRGYRVTPFHVASATFDELAARDAVPTPELLGRTLASDACLQLVVRDFVATGTRPLQDARWDLEWRLLSLRGQGVSWSWTSRGSWQPREVMADPHRALDAEPGIVPIGGEGRAAFRDARELVAALHTLAASHLPAGPR